MWKKVGRRKSGEWTWPIETWFELAAHSWRWVSGKSSSVRILEVLINKEMENKCDGRVSFRRGFKETRARPSEWSTSHLVYFGMRQSETDNTPTKVYICVWWDSNKVETYEYFSDYSAKYAYPKIFNWFKLY